MGPVNRVLVRGPDPPPPVGKGNVFFLGGGMERCSVTYSENVAL